MLDTPSTLPALGPTGGLTGGGAGTALARRMSSVGGAPLTEERMADIRRTAQDYEAVFLTQMMEHMFADVEPDSLFGGGQAETTYRSLLLNEYGKQMASAGGIGLADQLTAELIRLQESAS